eukprot:8748281-Lingulodinium_polyedra.AAC.1
MDNRRGIVHSGFPPGLQSVAALTFLPVRPVHAAPRGGVRSGRFFPTRVVGGVGREEGVAGP